MVGLGRDPLSDGIVGGRVAGVERDERRGAGAVVGVDRALGEAERRQAGFSRDAIAERHHVGPHLDADDLRVGMEHVGEIVGHREGESSPCPRPYRRSCAAVAREWRRAAGEDFDVAVDLAVLVLRGGRTLPLASVTPSACSQLRPAAMGRAFRGRATMMARRWPSARPAGPGPCPGGRLSPSVVKSCARLKVAPIRPHAARRSAASSGWFFTTSRVL